MAYQFAHVETYSRNGGRSRGHTVTDILAEARRCPEACTHVAHPLPPVLVAGVDLAELEKRHDRNIEAARETLTSGKTRAVRKDTASLFTAVISHPATPTECRSDPDLMKSVKMWAKASAQWLRRDIEARGGVLESVIMHIDESHVHLHAYGLHPSGHADLLHAGKRSKKDAMAAALSAGHDKKAANRFGDRAYVEAMRAWQDSYSTDVGLAHGLTRLGPARRRLSRAEWKTEQAAAKSVERARKAVRAAQVEVKTSCGVRDRIIEQGHQTARKIALKAHREIRSARALRSAAADTEKRAQTELVHARQESDALRSDAMRYAKRVRSIGSLIRSLWDSMWESTIRKRLMNEAQAVITAKTVEAKSAADRLRNETARRRDAERQLGDAVASARRAGRERDEIRARHRRLLGPETSSEPRNRPILG